jgi:hypothetical protein
MARDYVNVREERRDGQTLGTFATVSREGLKSAPAKVTRLGGGYLIVGVAGGAPIAGVEVRIDTGPGPPRRSLATRHAGRGRVVAGGASLILNKTRRSARGQPPRPQW